MDSIFYRSAQPHQIASSALESCIFLPSSLTPSTLFLDLDFILFDLVDYVSHIIRRSLELELAEGRAHFVGGFHTRGLRGGKEGGQGGEKGRVREGDGICVGGCNRKHESTYHDGLNTWGG